LSPRIAFLSLLAVVRHTVARLRRFRNGLEEPRQAEHDPGESTRVDRLADGMGSDVIRACMRSLAIGCGKHRRSRGSANIRLSKFRHLRTKRTHGIRAVDLTPVATQRLSGLGVDVIKLDQSAWGIYEEPLARFAHRKPPTR
jgi:hypothetical protein